MENTNFESDNSVLQLKEEFSRQLVDSYQKHFNIELQIEQIVMNPANPIINFHMITTEGLRFCVFFASSTEDMSVTDNYIQSVCERQIENYIEFMIKDAFIKVTFIEDFEPETAEGILYDEYISKHKVSDVVVKIFATDGTVEESMFEIIHQRLVGA